MTCLKIIGLGLIVVGLCLAAEEDLTVGNQKFSVKLFREFIRSTPNDNVVFSPLTLQMVMGLLTAATKKNSPAIKEVISVLELPSKNNIGDKMKELITLLKEKNDYDFKLFDANKIYFATGCTVRDWFNDIAKEKYNAETEIIDFKSSTDAANNINRWVAGKTNDYIPNFIQSYNIPSNLRMLLLNALYLSGKWMKPFEKHVTKKRNFYSSSGTKPVDMMKTDKKTYDYYNGTHAKYLKLDLVRDGGGAEMVFVLPHKQLGLDDLLENHLEDALSPNTPFGIAEVTVSIPKFKITNDLSIKTILQNMGVTQIFKSVTMEGYNFNGYIRNTIADVLQKAVVEVDEWGVTFTNTIRVINIVDASPNLQVFNADHPFMFYIRVDDVIVAAGRVMEL